MTRPELLAELFNAAERHRGRRHQRQVDRHRDDRLDPARPGRDPTVMNGAVMKNFVAPTCRSRARWSAAAATLFVSEVDESDGSIALYQPKVAVLNNISLDHKSLDELRALFGDFAGKAEAVIVNLDDDETRLLAAVLPSDGWSPTASPTRKPTCSASAISRRRSRSPSRQRPAHRRDRAGGAAGAGPAQRPERARRDRRVMEVGVSLAEAAQALAGFTGLRRRLERIGRRAASP